MNSFRLILATALVVACWTTTVSSRAVDIAPGEDGSLDIFNSPAALDFEGGGGDLSDGDNVRDKRTPRVIFRTVSCLFTFLINPSCLQGITGGGGDSGSSFGSNRRQQNTNSEPYYMISLPRYNDTDNNGTATEFPIYPIESTSEYPEDNTPSRPTNPILGLLQWKMNLIPNMIRRFFPGFGGGRKDDSRTGSGFNFANFNLGNLGLGQGRFAGLLGGQNRGGGGAFGGLGGGFGGQY